MRGVKITFLLAIGFLSNSLCGQSINSGTIYVSDNSEYFIQNGNLDFDNISNATTQTTRTDANYGKVSFTQNSGWINASDAHFLDGYGRSYSPDLFILPVGQSGIFAPVGVDPVNDLGIDGAYFASAPSAVGTTLGFGISSVSTTEYWRVLGSSSKITLTYRASSNATFISANNLPNLIIAGWNGTQWEEIPSSLDPVSILGGTSTLISGSITSTSEVNLATYQYFTLAGKDGCAPLIASSGNIKTWNGGWSPSPPTLADPVIINSPYSGTSFVCNSLELNSNVTLADDTSVEIVNGVTGSGKIIMSSEAIVVQRNATSLAPNIELTKSTRPMRRYDYVYWGTPIAGNFFSQLNGAVAQGFITPGAFDLKYKFVPGPAPGNGWQNLTTTETGKGYIMRVKQQAPFVDDATANAIDLKFAGVSNNGDVQVNIIYNTAATSPTSKTHHNLVANPYPSAIDAGLFLKENTDIDGVVYLWAAKTPYPGTGNYTQADFAAWNLSGTVNTSPIPTEINGKIASGQGFIVRALNSGSVTFTNCMRLTSTGSNGNFFRTSASEETTETKDKFKVNLTTSNNVFSQILIAYSENSTAGYDRLYDATKFSTSTSQLYSLLDDNTKLAINGKGVFDATDIVKLGLSKDTSEVQEYSMTVSEKEGVFLTDDVKIYLHDKTLNQYHDFDNGAYSFFINGTATNDRFEVVYQTEALSNTDYDNIMADVFLTKEVVLGSANEIIESLAIYDVAGRLVENFKKVNNLQFSYPFHHAEGVYIAKLKLDNGKIFTKKLINANKL
ncbi:T9SS type A sorting domain-containing protein [Flavobacterium dankookense]|uniref:Putative secreted protein (Por secretion system target) n=1 Tax=Flavobacterium dankookense TaxID=706186 RepID=A0A4R6QHR7_9FLAO|nr:T9SS type A sorting domain-containing protein [Flavobacterium dankookense]TDP61139.1 putative secreted protein (Por secretion system target) [Flavobacterium dankookense]